MSKTFCISLEYNKKMIRYRNPLRILQSNKTDRKLLTVGIYCSRLKDPASNLSCPWWSTGIPVPKESPRILHPTVISNWLPSKQVGQHSQKRKSPMDNPCSSAMALHPVQCRPPRNDGCIPGVMATAWHRTRLFFHPPSSTCQSLCCLLPSDPELMPFDSDLLQIRAGQQRQNATCVCVHAH